MSGTFLCPNYCGFAKVVIGKTKEVKNLDKKHMNLKELSKSNRRDKELEKNYMEDLAHVQTQVLTENRKLQASLVEWEKDYVLKNGLLAPSIEQMKSDKTASCLLNKIKYASALLSEWKIYFTC